MIPPEGHGFSPDEVVQLAPEAQRAYDSIVRPNAILPIPRYFLERWLPLLGTSRAWLTLAFRQVAFVSRSGADEVPVRTTLRKLGRWCGLTHVRVQQILKTPDHLTWFVRNPHGELSDHKSPRSNPSTYMVRSDIPLTPRDQARLALWLKERDPTDDNEWLIAIEEAIKARDLELTDNHILPSISLTIQQLVYAQRNDDTPLPPSLDQACTELHARWVQPDRVSLSSHYFMVRWLPYLSPGLGWLIQLLRSRVYQQGDEQVGQIWLPFGWSKLAADLGVSRKSLSRWVASPEAKLFFQRRADVKDPTDRRSLLLVIRLSEPIHPSDQAEYESLLEGQSLTSPLVLDGQDLTRQIPIPGQSLTSCGEPSTHDGKNLTTPGQDLPAGAQDLTSSETLLNKQGTKLNALSPLKTSSSILNQFDKQQDSYHRDEAKQVVVDPNSQWQIDEILTRSGVGKELRHEIIEASITKQQAFIGWILFALTVPRINYPVLFACKRQRENLPPEAFIQLARMPIVKLLEWLTDVESETPVEFEKAIVDLRKQRAKDKLFEIGALNPQVHNREVGRRVVVGEGSEVEGQPRERRSLEIPNRTDGLTADRVWQIAKGQLQLELPKTTYDTWVRDVEIVGYEDGTFIFCAANDYAREWLNDRLKSTIERVLTGILGDLANVRFELMDEVHR